MSLRHWPDFRTYVSLGLIQNVSALFKFGVNPDIDTGTTPEDIWEGGGEYPFPAVAGTISIVSDSIDDDISGVGAQTIRVSGLSAEYEMLEEIVELDGINPVVTLGVYLRCHRATVINSGTDETNAGKITGSINGDDVFIINPETGQTLQTIYTVPKDHALALDKLFVSIQKKSSAIGTFYFQIRPVGGSWNTKQTIGVNSNGSSSFERGAFSPFTIPEKTDIRIRCFDISANDTQVAAGFDGLLYNVKEFQF